MMMWFDSAQTYWWAEAILRASWQGAALIVIAEFVFRLWKTASPALVAWVWRLVILKMLIGVALPISVSWPIRVGEPLGATNRPPSTLPHLIAALSLLGVVFWFAHLLRDWRQARMRVRQSRDCHRYELLAELQTIAKGFGLVHWPALRESESITHPMLVSKWGIPGTGAIIILPASLVANEPINLVRGVLAHEMAHVKRRDLLWGWTASIARAVFFFHPLVWLAISRLRRAQEQACDVLAVSSANISNREYGALLVRLAANPLSRRIAEPLAAGVVEDFQSLQTRLWRIGQPPSCHGVLGIGLVCMLCLAALPTWRWPTETSSRPGDLPLFIQSIDGQPMSIPVVIGDGMAATVVHFGVDAPAPNSASDESQESQP